MNYKKIFNVVGVVAVTVVFSIGCSEKPDDEGGGGGKGSDISKYKTVKIGTQTWMAENLDNAVSGSVCYNNSADSCAKYGRLYTWDVAKTACPAGWHLPTDAEWTMLTDFVGDSSTTGTKLKATSGWNNSGNGTDNHGFSALPGGVGRGGVFGYVGDNGTWWSATEDDADSPWFRSMYFDKENVYRSNDEWFYRFSVRCVQN